MSNNNQQNKQPWLSLATELQAIAQAGKTYCNDKFCYERYANLEQLAAKLLANITAYTEQELIELFIAETGYPTPKLDVRGAVFKDNKILLVQERSDKLWTLPGGWADINEAPAEAIVREIYEESGYKTKTIKLAALLDKQKYEHPPQIPHAYKCFFICEILSKNENEIENIETMDQSFFSIDQLPRLSTHRITSSQIKLMFKHYNDLTLATDYN